MIRENSFLKNADPIVYGDKVRTVRFTTVEDIINLKNAGVSDEVIQAILTVVGDSEASDRKAAYDFLRDMNIRVDLRGD